MNSRVKSLMNPQNRTPNTGSDSQQENVALPPEIQQHLGNLLKASYNDVLTAPIPDRFLKLLEQLDSTSSSISAPSQNPAAPSPLDVEMEGPAHE